jgi:hypothetical protein
MKKEVVDQNKPWQHGYSLEFLKSLEKHFETYNAQVRSPFGAFKKNHIAAALHDDELIAVIPSGFTKPDQPKVLAVTAAAHQPLEKAIAFCTLTTAKVSSDIVMFHETVIGVKEKDDKVIQRFACLPGHEQMFADSLKNFQSAVWLYILEEDPQQKLIAQLSGYKLIGVKINTHADIFGVYFKDSKPHPLQIATGDIKDRPHPIVPESELVTLAKFETHPHAVLLSMVAATAERIPKLGEFTNHFSNYNPKNAWGALSLRGYSPDPTFISKPGVMDGKNQVEEDAEMVLQDTELANVFPEAMNIAHAYAGKGKLTRLRLMKLMPGGGELTRHTDLVEKDAGTANGKIMRLHFPIITNDKVDFSVWNVEGKKVTVNMKVGEVWYLDLRKPHTVANNGNTVRIHLVADIECSSDPKTDVRRFLNADSRVA